MKFSLFAIASIVSSASAEFSLRAAVNQLFATDQEPETYDARIVVGGLKDVITEYEAKHVAKHAMAAYNDVFSVTSTGQKLEDIEATAATNIPADSYWWTGECRFCANNKKSGAVFSSEDEAAFINARVGFSMYEDSMLSGLLSEAQDANSVHLHQKFEEDMCLRLRLSGLPNFVNAKNCAFSFLAKPGMTEQVPVEHTYLGKIAQAELILAGLKDGITESEAKFLDQVVLDCHNEAFAKYGLTLEGFHTLADVAVGGFQGWLKQCTPCCYDDEPLCPDDTVQNSVTVVVANAIPSVSGLKSVASIKPIDVEISANAFETLICTKLRNSGNPTFEEVHTCNFNFVYTEVGKATSALVN